MEINLTFREKLSLLAKILKHQVWVDYQTSTNEYEVTKTQCGLVKGRKRRNVYPEQGYYYAFEGIPYAQPPVGKLRFRSPKPMEDWNDILDCTKSRSKPMQYNYVSKFVEGSEDCLYLNVYTKKMKSEKPLPVMVWIFGGGYHFGEASRDFYGPDYFMQQDVVVVTFNYRLGIFGFLCFDDPDLNIPGNAGLKDQVLALKWIKNNIQSFNGDPNNITLFGQSAGAASTHLMTMLPQTKGLFHKAIMHSGSVLCPWACTEDHKVGLKYARHVGYKGDGSDKSVYEFLNKLKSKQLAFHDLQLLTKSDLVNNYHLNFLPVVESFASEDCITNKPFKDLMPHAWGNTMPMMMGATSSEGLLYQSLVKKFPFLIDELSDFVNLLPDETKRTHPPAQLKEMGLKLANSYFDGTKLNASDNLNQFLNLLGCRSFWHGVYRSIRARRENAKEIPTYCFYFDFDSKFFNHFRVICCGPNTQGVCHSDDVSYLFYGVMGDRLDVDSKEYRCIQRMIGMWYNFALTSNPNCEATKEVHWQPVGDLEEPIECLAIGEEVEFKTLPIWKELKLWDSFYRKEELN
uniref:carboxylesterase n=1 Tax=Stomoxys calcitrans TaxID=35570 RepID=A0A1I8PK08_STOCA